MHPTAFYPIGIPGHAWGEAERSAWRARQQPQRSYAQDVLQPLEALRPHFDVQQYGELRYEDAQSQSPSQSQSQSQSQSLCFPLLAVRSRPWRADVPSVLVTGGVHGYETSGVHGALRFLQTHAQHYDGRVNLLVVPCVSPWAYERLQRWNFDAIDPNRSFRADSPAQEAAALMRLVAPQHGQFAAHVDLHETTDTDNTEFRPALAARDGKPFAHCNIPDGFYLVDDTENPQPQFQAALIEAVSRVTPIAQGGAQQDIIGTPLASPGVIRYANQALGLCAGVSGARYTTTTEVYPDSPRATPEQCIQAQVAAVCAAIAFVLQRADATGTMTP